MTRTRSIGMISWMSGVMMGLAFSAGAEASVIAIVDSGTDLAHKDLAHKKWKNSGEVADSVDNDRNGLVDDVHGWNFADKNNQLIDLRWLGKFSPEVKRFFELQNKAVEGAATTEEVEWLKKMQADPEFAPQAQAFGGFVHGTHVAGIAAQNADAAKLMILKILPTGNPPKTAESQWKEYLDAHRGGSRSAGFWDQLIQEGLKYVARQQAGAMASVGNYLSQKNSKVANCSFAESTSGVAPTIARWLKVALFREPTPGEVEKYSRFFVQQLTLATEQALVAPARETFFVLAAGNNGVNNDVNPTSPANIKAENTITVAASIGYSGLAFFSNYGEENVDVAAPGVSIVAAIPGGESMALSGTSMAAPFVTNVAGAIWDINPSLTHREVKSILMETVDRKDFLARKVKSSGIVNRERALRAAQLSLTMGLSNALQRAKFEVSDVSSGKLMGLVPSEAKEGFAFPIPGYLR